MVEYGQFKRRVVCNIIQSIGLSQAAKVFCVTYTLPEFLTKALSDPTTKRFYKCRLSQDEISADPMSALIGILPRYVRQPRDSHIRLNSATLISKTWLGTYPFTMKASTRDVRQEAEAIASDLNSLGVGGLDTLAYSRTSAILSYGIVCLSDAVNCNILPLTSVHGVENSVQAMRECGATVWLAHENEILAYTKHIADNDVKLPALRTIIAMGRISEAARKSVIQALGHQIRINRLLFNAGMGLVGYQCHHCRDDEFHIGAEHHYTEIIAAGQNSDRGELVTTNLVREYPALIRVRTGVLVERTSDADVCACGTKGYRIRYLGSVARKVSIEGVKLKVASLEKLVSQIQTMSTRPMLVIRKTSLGHDQVSIHSRFYEDAPFRNLTWQMIYSIDNLIDALSPNLAQQVFESEAGIEATLETSSGVVDLRQGAIISL